MRAWKSNRSLAIGACIGLFASAEALPDSGLLGLYGGVGGGLSKLNQVSVDGIAFVEYPENRASWKLIAGFRPLSWFGAEIEYIDFGKAHVDPFPLVGLLPPTQVFGADATAHAGALFAVGYLPLPLPWIDVYGKVGFANLRGEMSYSTDIPNTTSCPTTTSCGPTGQAYYSESNNHDGVAYGGGVQFHIEKLSFRLEYERFSSELSGNPQLASLGLIWTF